MTTTMSLVGRRPPLPIPTNERPLVAVAHSNAAILDAATLVIRHCWAERPRRLETGLPAFRHPDGENQTFSPDAGSTEGGTVASASSGR